LILTKREGGRNDFYQKIPKNRQPIRGNDPVQKTLEAEEWPRRAEKGNRGGRKEKGPIRGVKQRTSRKMKRNEITMKKKQKGRHWTGNGKSAKLEGNKRGRL